MDDDSVIFCNSSFFLTPSKLTYAFPILKFGFPLYSPSSSSMVPCLFSGIHIVVVLLRILILNFSNHTARTIFFKPPGGRCQKELETGMALILLEVVELYIQMRLNLGFLLRRKIVDVIVAILGLNMIWCLSSLTVAFPIAVICVKSSLAKLSSLPLLHRIVEESSMNFPKMKTLPPSKRF